MTLELVVSIINYRTAELTLACVESVLADMAAIGMTGQRGRVVVVDNRSDDGSDRVIADRLATLRDAAGGPAPVDLVLSATNSGFSGGHNQGMAAHAADHYLILNSDALLRPGFLAAILAAARAHPEAGLFAPRIETDDGEAQTSLFRFHGPLSELIRSARTGLVTRLFRNHEVALGPEPPTDARIDWASFACILLSGRMVAQIGPMDEGYFLYFEDAEYCLRARRAGWTIVRVPEARMVHFRGGSGPVKALARERARLPAYYYASRSRFLYQAHGRAGPVAANLLWYLGRAIAHASRLTGRRIGPMSRAEGRDIWINALNPTGPRRAPWEDPKNPNRVSAS